jgi:hypothetical protein
MVKIGVFMVKNRLFMVKIALFMVKNWLLGWKIGFFMVKKGYQGHVPRYRSICENRGFYGKN